MLTQEDLKNIGELMDIKLTFLESRIEAKMDARFDAVEARLDTVETRLDTVEARLGTVEARLGTVETRIYVLEENVNLLSESITEVRCTVNVVAAWADKTSKIVKVAL